MAWPVASPDMQLLQGGKLQAPRLEQRLAVQLQGSFQSLKVGLLVWKVERGLGVAAWSRSTGSTLLGTDRDPIHSCTNGTYPHSLV